ncbi:HTH-type transcriptional regulator [Amycolatopsis sp. YIM 10]|nr:HTH-type transcriptional regulator [Amycolatopsis sp. YIM 10]
MSQHLRVLKEARLVLVRPVGTRRIYEVDLDGLATLREELDEFWGNALENFKRIAETGQP